MKASKAQLQANAKYRNTQKRVEIVIPLDEWENVQEYAAQKGQAVAVCIKTSLFRCMEQDGFTAQEDASTQASTQGAANIPGMQENATGL